MPDVKRNREILYNALKSEGYTDIGKNLDEFNTLLDKPGNDTVVYDAMKNSGYTDIGKDIAEFRRKIYEPKQAATDISNDEVNKGKEQIPNSVTFAEVDGMTGAARKASGNVEPTSRRIPVVHTQPEELIRPRYTPTLSLQGDDRGYGNSDAVRETMNVSTGGEFDLMRSYKKEEETSRKDVDKAQKEIQQAKKEGNPVKLDFARKNYNRAAKRAENAKAMERSLYYGESTTEPSFGTQVGQAFEEIGAGLLNSVGYAAGTLGAKDFENSVKAMTDEWVADNYEDKSFFASMLPNLAGAAATLLSGAIGGPGAAAAVGKTWFGTQVASSAGSAMREAEKYGATRGEMWTTGVSNAAVEYFTEKIPLDKILGKIPGKYGKVSLGKVGDAAIDAETEKLNQAIIKSRGINLKEIVQTGLVEGGTEAVASASQTALEMIYKNPEDYPTLTNYIENTLEGLAGGLLLGGATGTAQDAMKRSADNKRRREAGKVDFAVAKKDGKEIVGEVIGKEKNGNIVIETTDGYIPVQKGDINKAWSMSYDDYLAQDIETAKEVSYSEDVTGQSAAAKNKEYLDASREVRRFFGLSEDADIDAEINLLGQQTDEDAIMVIDNYRRAKARMEGAIDRYQDTVNEQYAEVDEVIGKRVNKDNPSMVYSTMLDGQNVYITGGNVVLREDGTIDIDQSSDLYVTYPDGRVMPVSENKFTSPVTVESAEALKAARKAEIDAQWQSEFDSAEISAEEQEKRDKGLLFDMTDKDGQHTIEVVSEGEDMSKVLIDGNQKDIPTTLLNQFREEAGVVPSKEAAEVAAPSTVETEMPEAAPVVNEVAPKTALEQIPRDENGVPLYEQVGSELAWDGIVEEAGGNEETAMVVINSMIADKKAALKKAENAKAKSGATITEKIAAENERIANIEKAKADLAKWEEIAGVKAKRAAAQAENVAQSVAETASVVESAPVAETPQATNKMQEANLENGEKGQKAVEPVGENKPKVRGRKQVEKALEKMRKADAEGNALEVLNNIQTAELNAKRGDEGAITPEELAEIDALKKKYAELGYEVVDLTGMEYDRMIGNLAESEQAKIGQKYILGDVDWQVHNEGDKLVVKSVVKPAIIKDGVIVQKAKVLIGPEGTSNDIFANMEKTRTEDSVSVDNQGNPVDADGKLIIEEVASIDEITDEDFENPTRNVQLPAIPENVANAIGTEGRPVVIKKNVFTKNSETHVELDPEDSRNILSSALYNPNLVGSTQPIKRPDYKVAIRTGEKNAVVVLDVYREKDYVEIVGWRLVNEKGLAKMQRQAEREGGQFLILSPNDGSAAALSALPLGSSSASEGTTQSANVQENAQKSGETAEDEGENAKTPMQKFANHAENIAKRLGVNVTIHTDASTVTNKDAMKAITDGNVVKGWYNPNTGEIALYLPAMESMRDVERTILHEAVAHYGIKHLLGREQYNKFLDGVWDMMPTALRAHYLQYVGADMKNPSQEKMRQAADEYVAHIAEKMDLNELEKNVRNKLIDLILDALRKIGFKNLGRKDIENVIKASYRNLRQNGGNSQVTGQGETMASKKMSENTDSKVIFETAKDIFGTTYDMREAGYILPDGTMLDFSGKHQVRGTDNSFLNGGRTVDHREIKNIAYDFDENPTGVSTDMGDFLDRGAIRIDYNVGAINLNTAPTAKQKALLKRLIERNDGDVTIDFGKGWDTEHYAEYESARASRVLGDIDRYYSEGIKPGGNTMFRIAEVNDKFNSELESLNEENADKVVLNVGNPSPVLLSAGVEDRPMKLYGNKIIKKAKKHGFKIQDLKNLPSAVADPIAVFDNYQQEGNRSILTELRTDDGNILATVDLGKGMDIDFNIISSAFGKSDNKIVSWINKGFATYINKEKALDYLHLSAPIAEASDKQELSSAAKIVESFENPTVESENSSENPQDSESGIRFRKVTDPAKIAELEAGEKMKTYRAMALIDGKLYPPMSSKSEGVLRESSEIGVWEEAEERRNKLAVETEDVRREDQIFMYDNLGVSASEEVEKQRPFHEMIDDLYNNENVDKSKYARTYFHVAKTPDFMTSIGLVGAEFTIPFKAISTHIGKDSDHYLDADIWHSLPEALQNPFLVTKYGKDDRFRIYTTLMHDGKYVAVGVDVKRINQGRNKPIIEINSIKTVFAKTGKIGENETVVCYDERITPEQEALLDGRNFRQYPTIQELSTDKGNTSPAEMQEGETLFSKKELTPEEKERQNRLKENAKAIRRLHNVKANYPITALRNLGFALETQEQRDEHDRLFAERDAISGRQNAVSAEVNPQSMTLMERITESLMKAAEKNKENVDMRMSAIRAYGRDLSNVLKLMRAQRGYDRNTVRMFTNLVKMYLRNNSMSGMSSYDITRLLGLIERANGGYGPQVMRAAEQIAEIITKSHTRELEDIVRKQIKTGAEKVNASGVVVQGGVDIVGKRVLNTFRDAINMTTEEEFEKAYKEAFERAAKFPNDAEAKAVCDAMVIAKEYRDNIADRKAQEKELQKSIGYYSDIRQKLENGEISRREYNEFADSVRRSIVELRAQMVDDYQKIIHALGGDITEGIARAKAFRERELARIENIRNMADADMEGVSKSAERKNRGKIGKFVDYITYKNPLLRLIMTGMGTYNEFMKFFGRNAIGGKGKLYNYFIGRYTEAQNQEWKEKQADIKKMDDKCKEIFGKDFISVMRDSSKNSGVVLEYWNGGERVSRELSIGQLMYIYMTAKQTDGEMKLRGMGITEETVNRAVSVLPDTYKAYADWVQSEFLPEMRPRMNKVHQRMFGASMSEVENYFPLVVNTDARQSEVDINSVMPITPSTITGAVIKRKVNATPLDLEANAFDVLMNHVNDMEHWAAFAEFTRDNNTLISDKDFMNRVKNSKDLRYGDGEMIWNDFVDCARITTENYQSKNDYMSNIMKGANSAKITFGYYTALKQFLSAPGLWTDASWRSVIKATANPMGSWKWAIENLPGFEERWKGRTAGNERLADSDNDWSIWDNRVVKAARELGMSPNAFVDAVVVATGARAVYETRKKLYKSIGLPDTDAHKRAQVDAAVAYNETQQSAQGAYLSILQKEGGFYAMVMTLFRNSQMAYGRKVTGSMAETVKKISRWNDILENTEKKYKDMGLSEEEAHRAANREMLQSTKKDMINLVLFGYIANAIWALGEHIPYLLLGDDEEEKEKIKGDILKIGATGMFEGFALGGFAKELYIQGVTDSKYSVDMITTPFAEDFEKVYNRFKNDGTLAGLTQLLVLGAETTTGISPQRLIDDTAALIDFCNGNLDTATEVQLLALRLAKVPQSQIDKIYMDEAIDGDVTELAKRFVEYKTNREFFGIGVDRNKMAEKFAKKFDKANKEDLEQLVKDDNAFSSYYETLSPKDKAKLAGMRRNYIKEQADVKKEEALTLEEQIAKILYGTKEQNLVYYGQSTTEDIDNESLIAIELSKHEDVYKEKEKLKGEEKAKFKEEHKKELDFYEDLKDNLNDISRYKSKMKKRPEKAEYYMTKIRKEQTQAIELINEYYNE